MVVTAVLDVTLAEMGLFMFMDGGAEITLACGYVTGAEIVVVGVTVFVTFAAAF